MSEGLLASTANIRGVAPASSLNKEQIPAKKRGMHSESTARSLVRMIEYTANLIGCFVKHPLCYLLLLA